MRIQLIDIDSRKMPNLALMKLSTILKGKGHEVSLHPNNPEEIYISVIFQKHRMDAERIKEMYSEIPVHIGGPGMFPECGSIGDADLVKPDYDLYPSKYSQGFTTRGCIRKCDFCYVWRMEGSHREVQHPSEFHDEKFKLITLMDNNFLAASHEWIAGILQWFHDSGLGMNMTQGFDARLLTEEWAGMLKDIKHPRGINFAWDNVRDEPAILKAIGLLKDAGFNLKQQVSFYVLVGHKAPFSDDLYRATKLREMGVNTFAMPFTKADPRLRRLIHNCNRRHRYWLMKPLTS